MYDSPVELLESKKQRIKTAYTTRSIEFHLIYHTDKSGTKTDYKITCKKLLAQWHGLSPIKRNYLYLYNMGVGVGDYQQQTCDC